ncbi:MAG: phosphate ABC transporter substrate-binding protein PstS, partial [Neisseriaceae bacterium]|nr:phosphate ABC transporter substrate-binding protein PstS [Neisseriaceae bacterium]
MTQKLHLFKNYIVTSIILGVMVFFVSCSHNENEKTETINIVGAGASFPNLIYTSWSTAYYQKTKEKINYQSIGSSAGLKQLNSRTIDFAASDVPLSDTELQKQNYFQFPTIIGGIVMIVNLDGIGNNQLLLDGKVIADIYQGKIKKWNDPAIQTLNPDLTLPSEPIAVIHRSDGSGTTYIFSQYLSQVSDSWNREIGSSSSISWKVGIGGKGNDGIAVAVKTLKNSIGYVEYAYAAQNNLTYTKLINQSGHVVEAKPETFSFATNGLDWNKSFNQSLVNNQHSHAWPIASTTYIIIPKDTPIDKKNKMLEFFNWCFNDEGQTIVKNLDY